MGLLVREDFNFLVPHLFGARDSSNGSSVSLIASIKVGPNLQWAKVGPTFNGLKWGPTFNELKWGPTFNNIDIQWR